MSNIILHWFRHTKCCDTIESAMAYGDLLNVDYYIKIDGQLHFSRSKNMSTKEYVDCWSLKTVKIYNKERKDEE